MMARIFGASSPPACLAIVLEGSGFWARGIRAMLGNTHRTGSGTVRLRVHTTADEALEWLPAEHARRTGAEDSESLKVALRKLREEGPALALAP